MNLSDIREGSLYRLKTGTVVQVVSTEIASITGKVTVKTQGGQSWQVVTEEFSAEVNSWWS